MPVTVPTVSVFDNNDQSAQDAAGQALVENARSSRLKAISDALADEAQSRNMTTAAGVDQAIRSSYANQVQAPPTSADPATGGMTGGNLTDGQTQVQSIPYNSDTVKPAPSPIGGMQLPGAATAPPQPLNASALSAPPVAPQPASSVPPPPSPATMPAPAAAPAPQAPPVTPQSPGAQTSPAQMPQASPFDTPEFQNNLATHLASVPGAGQQLMSIKSSRDATIGKVMDMIANGHTDEARFTAQRNGLNIPDQFYTNSDMAAGLSYGQKAYPEDPDKGQAFFMAYTQSPGTTDQKVQAGLAAAGPPSSQAQKELNKALALGRGNYQTPGGGVVNLNPLTHVATPYLTPSGDAAKVTSGYGIKPGAGTQAKFMNVGGSLVYTNPDGTAKVVVPKNADPTTAITGIMNHIMSAGVNVDPEVAKAQAVKIYTDLKANQASSAISTQNPSGGGVPVQVAAPAPDTYDTFGGGATGSPGSSQANPLNAQTQSDIDNAPPGTFINANGSLFRK